MRYWIWAIFLVINPFYLFPPGNPQISDFLQAFVMLLSFGVIRDGYRKAIFNKKAYIGFLIYSTLANLVLYLFYIGNYKGIPMLSSIFYLYNTLVFFYVFGLAYKNLKKFITYTQWGVALSLFIQIGYFIRPLQGIFIR